MTRKLLFSVILLCLCFSLSAQRVERVYTKTGDIYEGFISEQVPGEYISVFAQKATITVPAKDVLNIRNDYRPFVSLTESAKEWFRETDDTLAVKLSTLEFQSNYLDDVLVVSKDAKSVKFISFSTKTYKIPWNSLLKTTKDYAADVPYGIRDIVTLKTGERLIGGIIEQVVGESLRVMTEDGIEHSVLAEDVLSVRSEAIDDQVDIWSQAIMLDRLFLEGAETIEGIIVSRVMGQKLNILNDGTNTEQSIPLECIAKYQKCWNKNYREYEPPVIDTTKLLRVNGIISNLTETFTDDKHYYVPESLSVIVKVGELFKIDIQNIECDRTIQAYRTEDSKYTVKEDPVHYGKSFPAIKLGADPVYETAFCKDEDGHDVCEVVLRKKGIYVLSINGFKSVLVIEAK